MNNKLRSTRIVAFIVLVASACDADGDPQVVIVDEPDVQVAEVSFTGIGTADASASVRLADNIGALESSNVQATSTTIRFELLSVGHLDRFKPAEDPRRFVYATFRAQDLAGDLTAADNVTFVPVATTQTLESTSVRTLLTNNGIATTGLVGRIAPSGIPRITSDGLFVLDSASVTRRLSETRLAAISRPTGVTNVFPTGFALRQGSVITFGFSLPLLGRPENPHTFSVVMLIVKGTVE
jgi:hypothetical protein